MIDLMVTTPDGGVFAIVVDADEPDHRGAYQVIPSDHRTSVDVLVDGQVDERGHLMTDEQATALGIAIALDAAGWGVEGISSEFTTWDPDGPANDEEETTFSTFEG